MSKQIEKSWPAAKVEMWVIGKIVPYDKNPRTHPQAQVDLIAKSMIEIGVTTPIMVDESGVIIYGHGRRLAAIKNGFKKYPVVVARGWSEKQKRAERIKDNSYGLMSGWDAVLMQIEIEELKLEDYPLDLLGFGEAQLVSFMTTPGPPDDFQKFGEDIDTEHECPVCHYRWSGKSGQEPQETAPAITTKKKKK